MHKHSAETIWSASFKVKNHTEAGAGIGYDRIGKLFPNSGVTAGSNRFTYEDRDFVVSEFRCSSDGFTFAFQSTGSAKPSVDDRKKRILHFDTHSLALGDAIAADGDKQVFEWRDLEKVPAWSDGDTLNRCGRLEVGRCCWAARPGCRRWWCTLNPWVSLNRTTEHGRSPRWF